MLLNIRHETICRTAQPAPYSIRQLRLTPRRETTQRAVSWRISAPGRVRQMTDAYGNVAHLMTLDRPLAEISIVVTGQVETADAETHVIADPGAISPLAYLTETPLTRADEAILQLAHDRVRIGADRMRSLMELMPEIAARVVAPGGETGGERSAPEALALGRGGSEDHAHLFIACCRSRGIPARYVSGYLYAGDHPDAAAHAWAEAWIDGYGWVSFDVTRARLAGGEYCRLAVGRDYLDACPVRSVRRDTELVSSVRVDAQQQQQQ
jgi:transglutaminase-like putative cysteine protease